VCVCVCVCVHVCACVCVCVLCTLPVHTGALNLNLVGYDNILTDGSGHILITDIGEGNTDTLICVTDDPRNYSSSDWYYDPTSQTTDPAVRIQSWDPQGWRRSRGTTLDGYRIIRLWRDKCTCTSVTFVVRWLRRVNTTIRGMED